VENDRVFRGSIPALYDQYLGPMIFSPYADDLAARLANLEHGRVLEIAAGTGVVTRALVSTLPLDVSIVATDLNQPMLDYASSQLSSERVTWRHKRTPNCCRSPVACSTLWCASLGRCSSQINPERSARRSAS
jgi:hypothetical protein